MSATTQLTTFSDLYTALENAVRVQTGVTATENQAKRYINIALQDMHLGFDYRYQWAERRGELLTRAPYTTGTVTTTQGSTAIAGASTAWNTADAWGTANMRAGGKIVIGSDPTIYAIASVSSDTAAVLTQAFVAADASGASYTYFEDEYTLDSDFLRPLDLDFFDEERRIEFVDRQTGRRHLYRDESTSRPRSAWFYQDNFSGSTAPVHKIVLYPAPDAAYIVPYWFITNKLAVQSDGTLATALSGDTDEPIVPLRYRHAIFFHALYHWYRDKKNDTRSQEVKAEYTDIMLRIAADFPVKDRRARLQPRNVYGRSARRPYTRAGGRYETGGWFDRLLDISR